MTLVTFGEIPKETPLDDNKLPDSLNVSGSSLFFTSEDKLLTTRLGSITAGEDKHYWSFGNFNMIRLIFWVLDQIGPAEIILSSYSISPKMLNAVMNRRDRGIIRNIRFIIDNRVRSMSPKPFALLVSNFNYRCISIHAKVACIWNQNWNITIVSSQNATDNPKWERGTIFTDKRIFDFDKKILEDAFFKGTT